MKFQSSRKPLLTITAMLVMGGLCVLPRPAANGQTQAEMNQMAYKEYDKADKAMNAAYKKLMSILDKTQKARLKAAQLAWIKFRDAEAAFRSLEITDETGTMYPMEYAEMQTEITEQRTKELNKAYKSFKEE